MRRLLFVPLAACLIICSQWGRAQENVKPGADVSRVVLKQWRAAGGAWRSEKAGVSGEVSETMRGFAVAEDAPFAPVQTVEVTITPLKRIGADWSAGGLCVYWDAGNYWRLALAESPDAASRYAELTLLQNREGVSAQRLQPLEPAPPPFAWKWNTAYRLRLTLAPAQIQAEVFDTGGARLWRIAYSLADATLPHVGWPAVGVQGMRAVFEEARQSVPPAGSDAQIVTSAALQERVSTPPWLSVPDSRLVVNPTMSVSPFVPPALAPSLPLHLAYYVGETPARLPYFWAWQSRPVNAPAPAITLGPAAEFTPAASGRWVSDHASTVFANGQMQVASMRAGFGSATTETVLDLERTPYLFVTVPRCTGQWALKVNAGGQAVDTTVQADTSQTGSFSYDLRALTDWHGKRAFKIIVFAIGAANNYVTVSSLRFGGTRDALPALAVQSTDWLPHQIVAQARTDDGDMQAESAVGLLDAQTVAQKLHIRRANAQSLTLSGQMPQGSAHWDEARHAVVLDGEGYRAVIVISRVGRWLGGWASGLDYLAGRAGAAAAPSGGVWAVALDNVQADEDIVVAARFAPAGDTQNLLDALLPLATPQGFDAALAAQAEAWNRRLRDVPQPLDFTLHALDARGATPEAIRRMYYKAWVFLWANRLPPLPENGFAYPQMPCGKMSLWDEGAPHARASSQWESFLAMQFMALADPQSAWQAYAGLLSLVAPDGSLGGEGLPSRHAQTAWTLYLATGERERLAQIYPALKRLLLWKAADPRWLYKNSTPPEEKDSEFVVHALMDMRYAQQIAGALDRPDEIAFWQAQLDALDADYHRWFWTGSGADTHSFRLYRASADRREERDRSWNLQGLVLPPALLNDGERDALLRLFRGALDRRMPFLVGQLSGFPKYNYTQRGVRQYGTPDEAVLMAESALRDVTLAGQFSENYTQTFPPMAAGVIPSVFGAAQILDGALWHNGIVGDSVSLLASLPGAVGVMNLRVQGLPVDVLFDGVDGLVTLQGAGLKNLRMPAGFQSLPLPDNTPRWRGTLPAQGGVFLP